MPSMPEHPLYAAIDLGSNSFHMIVARYEHGQLRVIDRIRDMVRLAGGLDEQGRLAPGLREEALASLARFGQRIAGIPDHQVSAVGTQTFRRLRNPAAFLVVAETALGCPIDIISGREEARLVYLGVAQGMPRPMVAAWSSTSAADRPRSWSAKRSSRRWPKACPSAASAPAARPLPMAGSAPNAGNAPARRSAANCRAGAGLPRLRLAAGGRLLRHDSGRRFHAGRTSPRPKRRHHAGRHRRAARTNDPGRPQRPD
jgi:hypothetical protein